METPKSILPHLLVRPRASLCVALWSNALCSGSRPVRRPERGLALLTESSASLRYVTGAEKARAPKERQRRPLCVPVPSASRQGGVPERAPAPRRSRTPCLGDLVAQRTPLRSEGTPLAHRRLREAGEEVRSVRKPWHGGPRVPTAPGQEGEARARPLQNSPEWSVVSAGPPRDLIPHRTMPRS